MKTPALVFGLTVLAGCGSGLAWYHPDKTAADFRSDAYDCEQLAYGYAANLGQRFAGNPFIVATEQLRCMELKHGWTRVRAAQQEAPVQPAAARSACVGSECIAK